MAEKDFSTKTFYPLKELKNALHDKKQGYTTTMKIGADFYPNFIPPHIEIILLDPAEETIIFRQASDPDSFSPRKGRWQLGRPTDAAALAVDWTKEMVSGRMIS